MKSFRFRAVSVRCFGMLGCALLQLAIIGCGPDAPVDENRTEISGAVTFNSAPLKAGTIRFESIEKKISTAVSIGSDGRYASNRVPLGPNLVTIETESLQYGSPHLYTKIPIKYADPSKSGLSADVKPGTNENVNFELKP